MAVFVSSLVSLNWSVASELLGFELMFLIDAVRLRCQREAGNRSARPANVRLDSPAYRTIQSAIVLLLPDQMRCLQYRGGNG